MLTSELHIPYRWPILILPLRNFNFTIFNNGNRSSRKTKWKICYVHKYLLLPVRITQCVRELGAEGGIWALTTFINYSDYNLDSIQLNWRILCDNSRAYATETVDALEAHLQLRGVAVSCPCPCLPATILSTGEFAQRVDRMKALVVCHVFSVAGRPVAGDCHPCERGPKGAKTSLEIVYQ
jgi:hypothetical protein